MSKKRKSFGSREFEASTPEQIAAIKSRLRGRICDVVYHMGQATVHEIADQLGRSVPGLYPHLEILVEAGLLLEGEPVRTGKNFARTYVARAERLRMTRDLTNPAVRSGIADVVSSQLRLADREFRASLEMSGVTNGQPDSRISSASMVGWLNDEQIREVNRLLGEVVEIFDGAVPGEGRSLQGLTFVSRMIETTESGQWK